MAYFLSLRTYLEGCLCHTTPPLVQHIFGACQLNKMVTGLKSVFGNYLRSGNALLNQRPDRKKISGELIPAVCWVTWLENGFHSWIGKCLNRANRKALAIWDSATISEKLNVLICYTGNWRCDSSGDLSRGSNHRSREFDLWFELPESDLGEFLRFGLCNVKSLSICDLWCGAIWQVNLNFYCQKMAGFEPFPIPRTSPKKFTCVAFCILFPVMRHKNSSGACMLGKSDCYSFLLTGRCCCSQKMEVMRSRKQHHNTPERLICDNGVTNTHTHTVSHEHTHSNSIPGSQELGHY